MQISFPTKVKRIVAMITHWVGNSSVVDNSVVALGWRVFKELGDDDATHLSAGVAYYSVFSVFPLLLGLLALSLLLISQPTCTLYIPYALFFFKIKIHYVRI